MQAHSLTLNVVELSYGEGALFPPLSARIEPGELCVIEGSNGSGKSTLLKALAGLHRPTSGGVMYEDIPLTRHRDYPDCVLFLGHKRALRPKVSVRHNIAYWARLHGAAELADTAMHYFDLLPYADTPCAKLSSGWQERVALARLLAIPAPIWLLDEPLSHLDADGIALVHSIITSRLEQGGIVIMTSHHPMSGERIRTINIDNQ